MKPEIIIALDYSKISGIKNIVNSLGDAINFYKIGLEAFISVGKESLEFLKSLNKKIFLDLKLHDIPNTVKKASLAAAKIYGIDILSLHIQGGVEMISETKKNLTNACLDKSKTPLLFGITILTSLDDLYLKNFRINCKNIQGYVVHLATIGKNAGLDGVVCSVGEASFVKQLCGSTFKIICPGIRLDRSRTNDQKRVYTPIDAKLAGADYIVMGRSITESLDPKETIEKIIGDLKDEDGRSD